MKLLLLSRYDRMGQSSRLRTLQYLPYLEERGIKVKAFSLFQDSYLMDIHSGKGKKPATILKALLKRMLLARHFEEFDIIWLEKEMLPWIPFLFEAILFKGSPPIVLDIDDADFHHYDLNSSPVIRLFLSSKIGRLMRISSLVIAGNDYLAEYAKRWGAQTVEKIPTVVDLARYPLKTSPPRAEGPVTIGWIGSPTTAHYLRIVEPVLKELSLKKIIKLVLVGSGPFVMDGVEPEIYPWSEEKEVELVSNFDIGIMPLADTPWERGKCGYKLIQYMACSKPVVATAFGANLSIITHGKEGFLAEGIEDWKAALNILISHSKMRTQMGREGRLLVEKRYCTMVTAPRLFNLLRNARYRKTL